jgi:hypothetical protein
MEISVQATAQESGRQRWRDSLALLTSSIRSRMAKKSDLEAKTELG